MPRYYGLSRRLFPQKEDIGFSVGKTEENEKLNSRVAIVRVASLGLQKPSPYPLRARRATVQVLHRADTT